MNGTNKEEIVDCCVLCWLLLLEVMVSWSGLPKQVMSCILDIVVAQGDQNTPVAGPRDGDRSTKTTDKKLLITCER